MQLADNAAQEEKLEQQRRERERQRWLQQEERRLRHEARAASVARQSRKSLYERQQARARLADKYTRMHVLEVRVLVASAGSKALQSQRRLDPGCRKLGKHCARICMSMSGSGDWRRKPPSGFVMRQSTRRCVAALPWRRCIRGCRSGC